MEKACEFCLKSFEVTEGWDDYKRFCSASCRQKNNVSKRSKESFTASCHLVTVPGRASEMAKRRNEKHSSSVFTKIVTEHNEFRRTHGNMSRSEWALWNNEDFRSLNPVYNDYRFRTHTVDAQGRYAPGDRGVIMDFSFPDFKFRVELDSFWHKNKTQKARDEERDKWLLDTHGWDTIRFTNDSVYDNIGWVIQSIKKVIDDKSKERK